MVHYTLSEVVRWQEARRRDVRPRVVSITCQSLPHCATARTWLQLEHACRNWLQLEKVHRQLVAFDAIQRRDGVAARGRGARAAS